jgi:putative flippase GtrA
MSEFWRLCTRFGRFTMVGLMGAALQLVLLDVLMEGVRLSLAAATPIAIETVILQNFLWHERLTWRDSGPVGLRRRVIRLFRFHASNGLISLVGNTWLTYYFSHQFKLPPLASAVIAISVCGPINFLIADCWVYREPSFGPTTRG